MADLESRLGVHPFSPAGAKALASGGLAMVEGDEERLTLRSVDRRLSPLVNAARLGGSRKGYDAQHVVRAVLGLGNDRKRVLGNDHRLRAYYALLNEWGIACDDLLEVGRRRVHLKSHWRAPRPPSGVRG